MRTIYKGTNTKPIKVWGIPFKEGEITEVIFIDEDHIHKESRYYDSDMTYMVEILTRLQQIDIRTKDDYYGINCPAWGYMYCWPKYLIDEQDGNFRKVCGDIVEAMDITEKKVIESEPPKFEPFRK